MLGRPATRDHRARSKGTLCLCPSLWVQVEGGLSVCYPKVFFKVKDKDPSKCWVAPQHETIVLGAKALRAFALASGFGLRGGPVYATLTLFLCPQT